MKLINTQKEFVEVEEKVAKSQFAAYAASVTATLSEADRRTSKNACVNSYSTLHDETCPSSSLEFNLGECSLDVMEIIAGHAKELFDNPRPPCLSYEQISSNDKQLMEDVQKKDMLIPLYDTAFLLGFNALKDICAAFLSFRIDRIASRAPDPLTGAAEIRDFLHMANEWTDEEMDHLRKEMKLTLAVDPSAY